MTQEKVQAMTKIKQFLPTKEELLRFIKAASREFSKREIIKAFNIKGHLAEPFKALLKEIEDEGLWKKNTRRDKKTNFKTVKQLELTTGRKKTVTTCEVAEVLSNHQYRLVPTAVKDIEETIVLSFSSFPLVIGQRLMALLQRSKTGHFEAKALKIFTEAQGTKLTIGVFQPRKNGGYVYPVSRKQKKEFYIAPKHTLNAAEGDIVSVEVAEHNLNSNQGKIRSILGNVYQPKGLSLISMLQHDLQDTFSPEALSEAEQGTVPLLGKREDLRNYDLVTIDGEDARDFDDAVFAEPTENNGWHIIVAIADVAHYVRPGSALDQEAFARGNSVYFPDRVLPMLPERLSNDLCSLRPQQDRACLAVHIFLDSKGHLEKYNFVRGLMRSKARLTYTEAQRIFDHEPKNPLYANLSHMYSVYNLLLRHRQQRGALDIDLPEHQVVLDTKGNLLDIKVRNRYDSHKLIEEFMILANICAAKALESKNIPGLFRVHDTPSESRVQALRDFLTFIKLLDKQKQLATPHDFNHVIYKVKDTAQHTMVSEMVLRSQQQAIYAPSNDGHFGLGLTHYAHFTSPIRRYADLIVHRSLIKTFNLGDDGLSSHQAEKLPEIAQHITEREKEAESAEREVINRYLSLYMLDSQQLHFSGRITGVTAFGLFVMVEETGITGMVPVASMPEFFIYNESAHELRGRSTDTVYRLGDTVKVTLQDVNVLTGQIAFNLDTRGGSKKALKHPKQPTPEDKPNKRGQN